jgi:hypothetical protein
MGSFRNPSAGATWVEAARSNEPNHKNFAPRAGIAYQLDSNMVLRTGSFSYHEVREKL